MSNRSCFIDSNIWLYYLLDNQSLDAQERERKRNIARSLTKGNTIVSVQVINEVCANALKKAAFTEQQIKELIQSFENRCTIVALEIKTLSDASELRLRYRLSFGDSLIVSSAISANAEVPYSEDMQDGLIIDQRLQIINPFK